MLLKLSEGEIINLLQRQLIVGLPPREGINKGIVLSSSANSVYITHFWYLDLTFLRDHKVLLRSNSLILLNAGEFS